MRFDTPGGRTQPQRASEVVNVFQRSLYVELVRPTIVVCGAVKAVEAIQYGRDGTADLNTGNDRHEGMMLGAIMRMQYSAINANNSRARCSRQRPSRNAERYMKIHTSQALFSTEILKRSCPKLSLA